MFDGLIDLAGNLLRTLALGLLFAVAFGVYGAGEGVAARHTG